MQKNTKNLIYYRITPTLINQWLRIYQEPYSSVDEDTYKEIAYNEFIDTLKRVKKPPNENMQKGIDYEYETCYGNGTQATPYIKDGVFQVKLEHKVVIDNDIYNLYGVLDCLKNKVIYDIKRVKQYDIGKYQNSVQHLFYLALFPEARAFVYVIEDDTQRLYLEEYCQRKEIKDEVICIIRDFISWLKNQKLYDMYKMYWNNEYIERERRKENKLC